MEYKDVKLMIIVRYYIIQDSGRTCSTVRQGVILDVKISCERRIQFFRLTLELRNRRIADLL